MHHLQSALILAPTVDQKGDTSPTTANATIELDYNIVNRSTDQMN